MHLLYAEASCVLKVNVHCESCKMHMLEVLGSICGKYNVEINSEEGLAQVHGLVDPNLLLKALARTGYHAELKWVKIRHPQISRSEYHYGDNHYGYGYGYGDSIDGPCSYNRALPNPSSYYGHSRPAYYYGSSNPNYYGSDLPSARYVPSYPPDEYGPCADENMSLCSIM